MKITRNYPRYSQFCFDIVKYDLREVGGARSKDAILCHQNQPIQSNYITFNYELAVNSADDTASFIHSPWFLKHAETDWSAELQT